MEPRFLRALDKVSATIDRNEVSQPLEPVFVRHFPLVNCFAETCSDMEGGRARSFEIETNQIKKFLDKTPFFLVFCQRKIYTIYS